MARIKPLEYENLNEQQKADYDGQINKFGRITNMKKTLLHNIKSFNVLMEWYDLRDEAGEFLSDREINVFCYAISAENGCVICSTYFRKYLKDNGTDPDNFSPTERENLLIDYGKKCLINAHSIDETLFNKMKNYWTDSQIVLLTAFAGMMIATNLINNALRVDLDNYLYDYTKK